MLVHYLPLLLLQLSITRLVVLDIKGAFDGVWWRGLLTCLWSIGFGGT